MATRIEVVENPIKNVEGITMTPEQLETQARIARSLLVGIDYSSVRGTCGDERERIGLKSGEEKVDVRPSAYGGPNIYGLYIAELSGYFGNSDETGEQRLGRVTYALKRNKVASGGHERCAANAGVPVVFGFLANPANRDGLLMYTSQELGDNYDEAIADEVINFAAKVNADGRYKDWSEDVLPRVLGDEAAQAIEILADVPHSARSVIKIKGDGAMTISQTQLHEATGGEDSYVLTESYMDRIENVLAAGPDASKMKKLAEHAREMLNATIFAAVPNKELHQINLILP